jgi:hypothetical protein
LRIWESDLTDQIQKMIGRLADLPSRIERAVAGADETALHLAKSDGAWAVPQILAHLRASNDILSHRIYGLLARSDQPLFLAFDERRWEEVAGYAQADFRVSLQTFALRRAELVTMLRHISADDWNRTFRHEERGVLSLLDGVRDIFEHEEEHWAQIEAILTSRNS